MALLVQFYGDGQVNSVSNIEVCVTTILLVDVEVK